MKRSGPPTRRRALGRSSAGLRRTEGSRRTTRPKRGRKPLRAGGRRRPPEGPLSPEEWGAAVWRLDGGRSIFSGVRVSAQTIPHHPIAKQELRRRGLHHLVWDPRNGATLTQDEHSRQESGKVRVPHERLPARCREFAAELGPWAEARLERSHPPAARREET